MSLRTAQQLFVYEGRSTTPAEFVSYWSTLYEDPREALYVDNIGLPLTPDRVRNLFIWKNGGVPSAAKSQSIETNYINRIAEVERLPLNTTASDFLDRFALGGAIWRIFWLHCWQPERFPIYDVHVHRAMTIIEDAKADELNRFNDKKKVTLYLERYLGFCERFQGIAQRQVDRALWTFGKFIRDHPPIIDAWLKS